MKKTIKDLFKLITAIATVAGILYVARDQIKAIIAKIKEVSDDDFDDDFFDEEDDTDVKEEDIEESGIRKASYRKLKRRKNTCFWCLFLIQLVAFSYDFVRRSKKNKKG